MTNEEAIKVLTNHRRFVFEDSEEDIAIVMAINELSEHLDTKNNYNSAKINYKMQDSAIKVDLITALSKLHTIESSDGQDYVQMYDVLETVKRYSAEQTDTAEWKEIRMENGGYRYLCSRCNALSMYAKEECTNCGAKMVEP